MSNFAYVAVDPNGSEMRGTLEVADQAEALRRIKEMGLFPTRILGARTGKGQAQIAKTGLGQKSRGLSIPLLGGRVKPAVLAVSTRQLATLVEAGMPLLRSLRTLHEQEGNRTLKRILGELALAIENGSSLAEAMTAHPKVFNRLYVNMVRAGEVSGALETTLRRLAEFVEKGQRLKGKVKAAMVYPCTVLLVAAGILVLLMTFVVPRFQQVFTGLLEGRALPAFTRFVFNLSDAITHHLPAAAGIVATVVALFLLTLQTGWGRRCFDQLKLVLPLLGPLFRKLAISRFARTLGTLMNNGVPILQALTIVKETAGNEVIAKLISTVHDNVKQGDPMAPTLKASSIFPAMVAGMVDVGEQTGALPDLLMKVADSYDEEVDNAASALTSVLEPIMILFLAVIVGSIVIAMFLPLIAIIGGVGDVGDNRM
jgi:type IV pilus assembly protein PilC